ncbi:hypothetical protein MFLAVUS_003886 [Mucor flavus]|uniref:Uncharacterized protein n=1 Tax=Mucor flavus TaxID=439312 RepID=A0ABP9YUD7_9FUNG
MTAQQLFDIPPHSTDSAMLQWVRDEIQRESKKRRRSIDHNKDLFVPPQKSPRKNDEQDPLIDTRKPNHSDILLAYKRIWNNLDLNSPADASLEPFVWRKIREYQQNK